MVHNSVNNLWLRGTVLCYRPYVCPRLCPLVRSFLYKLQDTSFRFCLTAQYCLKPLLCMCVTKLHPCQGPVATPLFKSCCLWCEAYANSNCNMRKQKGGLSRLICFARNLAVSIFTFTIHFNSFHAASHLQTGAFQTFCKETILSHICYSPWCWGIS